VGSIWIYPVFLVPRAVSNELVERTQRVAAQFCVSPKFHSPPITRLANARISGKMWRCLPNTIASIPTNDADRVRPPNTLSCAAEALPESIPESITQNILARILFVKYCREIWQAKRDARSRPFTHKPAGL
jgi:hypothetical protein